jgi:hypothetical protein
MWPSVNLGLLYGRRLFSHIICLLLPSSSLAKQPPPPLWATASLRRFCQLSSGFHFFAFRNRARTSAQRPTPNLEDQIPVFMSPSDWVVHLCPQAPGSLQLAGLWWRCVNLPPHRELSSPSSRKSVSVFDPQNGSRTFLRNVGEILPHYMLSYPSRLYFSKFIKQLYGQNSVTSRS